MDASGAQQLLAGRFRVVHELGSGGMGSVVLAEDELLGRQVAVKRLWTSGDAEMEVNMRRFQREARIGASLNHPNLVGIHDVVMVGAELLLVMEYVPGMSLQEALRAGRPAPATTVGVLRDVARGLDHAHAAGILHRDIKPANILLSQTGGAKLADLGLAQAADSSRLTRTGMVMGTVAFLSPEQMLGAPASAASDICALAAVAFEMVTGRRARLGRTPMEIARAVTAPQPPDPREADPTIPLAIADALRRGMAYDPALRPPSAGAFVEELVQTLGPPPRPVR